MTTERRTPARRSTVALGAAAASGMLILTGLIGVADAAPVEAPRAEVAAPSDAAGSANSGTLTVIVVRRESSATAPLATRRPPPAPVSTQAPAPQVATSAS